MAPSTRTDPRTDAGVCHRATRVALAPVADGAGPAVLHLSTGVLAPRLVGRTRTSAQVALVATTATLLGGDQVALDVEVGTGLRLDLTDVAGTVAYDGRGRAAHLTAHLRVAEGATLVWAGEPLVVAEGARVERRLLADVSLGGRLLVRDQVALGRDGEAAGALRCHTEVTYAGRPALVETVDLRTAALRAAPGILGPARVVDTVTAVGWRPTAAGDAVPAGVSVYALAAPGAQARALVRASHESTLPVVWASWSTRCGVRHAG